MSRRLIALLAGAGLVAAAALVWTSRHDEARGSVVDAAGDRRGLVLRMKVSATSGSLIVHTRVENRRSRPVRLEPDQCGRVTEVVLARTRFEPRGRRWSGSLRAVKKYILTDQRLRQDPDRFAPRRLDERSSEPPPCERPERPVELGAGGSIDERWELPFSSAEAIHAVGSAHSVVRAEIVEARNRARPQYLDIFMTGEAEAARRGRNLHVETPASSVVERGPTDAEAPSLGELYDRLLADTALRTWVAAQPARSWRSSELLQMPEGLRFKAVTARYERALRATARSDATDVELHVPTQRDRAHAFERRPGTLPPGVKLVDARGYLMTDDVFAGNLVLPSGRIVVDELFVDPRPLKVRVVPRAYPVHATLARYRSGSSDDVAFATLVLSRRPTVRWRLVGGVAVDGGTAAVTSPEGAHVLEARLRRDQARWDGVWDRMFDSLTAHDYKVTNFALDRQVNLALFTSGLGDGSYPVYAGFDTAARPTRIVVDFLLLHFKWR